MLPGHVRTAEQQNVFLVINVVYAVIFLIEARCSQKSHAQLSLMSCRVVVLSAFCLASSMKVVSSCFRCAVCCSILCCSICCLFPSSSGSPNFRMEWGGGVGRTNLFARFACAYWLAGPESTSWLLAGPGIGWMFSW